MPEHNLVHGGSLEVVTRPVKTITSPPFRPELREALIALLEQHGCQVHCTQPSWTITFPEGTIKREIYMRTMEERAQLTLPDGYLLFETTNRRGLSCLRFDPQDLPEAVRTEHADLIQELIERS